MLGVDARTYPLAAQAFETEIGALVEARVAELAKLDREQARSEPLSAERTAAEDGGSIKSSEVVSERVGALRELPGLERLRGWSDEAPRRGLRRSPRR